MTPKNYDDYLGIVKLHVLNGIDIDTRSIYWGKTEEISEDDGYVCHQTVESIIRKIHLLKNINSEPIHFYMHSNGGEEFSMWRLYDEIQLSNAPIVFHGSGSLMSATILIMLGCHQKFATENTRLMVHEGYGGPPATDKPTDIIIDANECKYLDDMLYKHYEKHTYCDYEFWATICRYNAYISSDEALTLGMIDGIETKEGLITRARNKKLIDKTMLEIKKRVYVQNINGVK
jgi:ATP-dependent protease ClpP protease subunit